LLSDLWPVMAGLPAGHCGSGWRCISLCLPAEKCLLLRGWWPGAIIVAILIPKESAGVAGKGPEEPWWDTEEPRLRHRGQSTGCFCVTPFLIRCVSHCEEAKNKQTCSHDLSFFDS
jgi:hypothetical protein